METYECLVKSVPVNFPCTDLLQLFSHLHAFITKYVALFLQQSQSSPSDPLFHANDSPCLCEAASSH